MKDFIICEITEGMKHEMGFLALMTLPVILGLKEMKMNKNMETIHAYI